MANYFVDNSLEEQRIIITQRYRGEAMRVQAPLPDGFGLTVGSEFATPFDTGNVNSTLSKALTIANISQKASIRMKKMYANPTPTEISFDMEFNSYYNAMEEVVLPTVRLMGMSLGRSLDWPGLKHDIEKLLKKAEEGINMASEAVGAGAPLKNAAESVPNTNEKVDENISKVADLFNIIQGPPTVEVKFGKVMRLGECYITSVGAKFSNVLDVNGYPTSCVCSVTVTPRQAPVMDDLVKYFNVDIAQKG
jgi:hypothetical protein